MHKLQILGKYLNRVLERPDLLTCHYMEIFSLSLVTFSHSGTKQYIQRLRITYEWDFFGNNISPLNILIYF